MYGKVANCYTLFRMIREIKVFSDWLDASLSFLSTSRRCSRNRSSNRLPVSLIISASYAVNTSANVIYCITWDD